MFSRFSCRPIAQQLIAVSALALVLVFSIMTLVVQRNANRAAVAVAETNLGHEAKMMAGMLDAIFEAVRDRGERQSRFFIKYVGGTPVLSPGTLRAGDVDLPVVRIGNEIVNGNDRILQAFKDLTSEEAAFLVIKDGKVFRLATLLKDKAGNPMNGVPLGAADPVSKAVLAGEDYAGLTIRAGKYNFSTVKVLKGSDGKPWGAYSVRIGLDAELKRVRDQFGGIVAGQTGYVYIIRPTDEKGIGEFVLHPKFQDKSIAEVDLAPPVKESLRQILASKSGMFRYSMPAEGGGEREKMIYAETAKTWGWTVATGSWTDEYLEESLRLRNLLLLISVISAIVLMALMYWMVRSRVSGLGALVAAVTRMSGGDFRVSVPAGPAASRNEVHEIGQAFNVMADSVRSLVQGVSATSTQVGGAANELQVAANMALESSQQASQSASGIAASVEQMSVSIAQVAENANQAARISEEAKSVTENGRNVVDRAMAELDIVAGDINESASLIESLGERSKQISSVVGVIREIADQTNLLALNAAIEAARAGEQGRGFAVVADEVRKLAERTALSTQEISTTVKAILEETGRAVQRMQVVSNNMTESVGLARAAGESLAHIDERATLTVNTVHSIADSTREQSSASQEIARLVEHIAQAAESSSGRAQSNSERAQNLQRLSGELQAQLSRFST